MFVIIKYFVLNSIFSCKENTALCVDILLRETILFHLNGYLSSRASDI